MKLHTTLGGILRVGPNTCRSIPDYCDATFIQASMRRGTLQISSSNMISCWRQRRTRAGSVCGSMAQDAYTSAPAES